jgi:hypothetical protein
MATTPYEFCIDGQLSEQAREAFCDLRIEERPGRLTSLYGEVIDESHLLGILAQFGVLGLVVVSAHPVVSGTWGLSGGRAATTTESRRPPPRGRSAGPSAVDDQVAPRVSDAG